jgi:hypothetical protein
MFKPHSQCGGARVLNFRIKILFGYYFEIKKYKDNGNIKVMSLYIFYFKNIKKIKKNYSQKKLFYVAIHQTHFHHSCIYLFYFKILTKYSLIFKSEFIKKI